jgi:hypothetical protein
MAIVLGIVGAVGGCGNASSDPVFGERGPDGSSDGDARDVPDARVDSDGTSDMLAEAGDVRLHVDADGVDASDAAVSCSRVGDLYFAPPTLVSPFGGSGGVRIAASADRKLAIVTAGAYWDSLDGGRTFRPGILLSQFGPTNLNIALRGSYVHITGAFVDAPATLMYAAAEMNTLRDESQFVRTQLGPLNTYVAELAPGPQGQAAVFLENGSLGGVPTEGTYVTVANTPLALDFSPPKRIYGAGECVGGLWHSSGTLYAAYQTEGSKASLEVSWSTDGGATFSAPLARTASTSARCPALYEQSDGNVLLIIDDGGDAYSTQRVLAVHLDQTTKHLSVGNSPFPAGPKICYSSTRTAAGRTYVALVPGRPGDQPQIPKLSYSDDDGQTWAAPILIPNLRFDSYCPVLAASNDELYLSWSNGEQILFSRAGDSAACD